MAAFTQPATTSDWQGGRSLVEACAYMFTNSVDTDVQFRVGEDKMPIGAHRFILVCRSSVFQTMLSGKFADGKEDIYIPDIEPDIFIPFLKYLYTEEAEVNADNVLGLLYTSKKYCVQSMVNSCMSFLNKSRTTDTVCSILEQAHLYDEQNFKLEFLRFILDHGQEVLPTSGFLDLCKECVLLVVQDDKLRCEEDVVFESVFKWANNQCAKDKLDTTTENLRKVLGSGFGQIRFPLLDRSYFTNVVADSPLLTDTEKVCLFKYFYKKGENPPSEFIGRPRTGRDAAESKSPEDVYTTERDLNDTTILKCERFGGVFEEDSWCSGENEDAITFSTSASIVLHGVLVYGAYIGDATFDAELEVYDCNDVLLASVTSRTKTSDSQTTYPLLLHEPVSMAPDRKYTVAVRMRQGGGKDTYQGMGGKSVVKQAGIKFTFSRSRRSKNGTDEKMGQIPGLLFSKVLV